MQNNERVVLDFIACWGISRHELVKGCYEKYFTEETVFENVGIVTLVGIAQAQQLLQGFVDKTGAETVDVEIVNILSSGDIVLVERLEHFKDKDGHAFMDLRAVGSFVVRNGKIVHWRDYLDSAYYEKWLASRAADKGN